MWRAHTRSLTSRTYTPTNTHTHARRVCVYVCVYVCVCVYACPASGHFLSRELRTLKCDLKTLADAFESDGKSISSLPNDHLQCLGQVIFTVAYAESFYPSFAHNFLHTVVILLRGKQLMPPQLHQSVPSLERRNAKRPLQTKLELHSSNLYQQGFRVFFNFFDSRKIHPAV